EPKLLVAASDPFARILILPAATDVPERRKFGTHSAPPNALVSDVATGKISIAPVVNVPASTPIVTLGPISEIVPAQVLLPAILRKAPRPSVPVPESCRVSDCGIVNSPSS